MSEDGGSAFPFKYETANGEKWTHYGMSQRDWFAGQSLAGMHVPDGSAYTQGDWDRKKPESDMKRRAKLAYMMADAMLQERKS